MSQLISKAIFKVPALNDKQSAAILLVRLVMGVAFVMHGWSKIQDPMGWMGPDAAIPGIFLALAALSEFGGGIGLILGLLNPLVAAGLASTMAVAVYSHVILWGDSFDDYELALVYAELGNQDKAAEHMNIALDIWKDADPVYKPAQKARAALEEWVN